MIHVLLVEDSLVFTLGLRMALKGCEDITLDDAVATPGAAVSYLNAHPDTNVVVVDITLEQETDGLTLLSILREAFPHVASLVLSHYKTPAYILQAITYGAHGYLAKDSAPETIAQAIREAAQRKGIFFGETIPAEEIMRLFGGENNFSKRKPLGLSAKELEVLQLVTSGYSNAQIATALGIATTTVDSYKERIKGKFGMDTMIECVAAAVVHSLVDVRK